jgi:hypothetical protein
VFVSPSADLFCVMHLEPFMVPVCCARSFMSEGQGCATRSDTVTQTMEIALATSIEQHARQSGYALGGTYQ